MRFVFDDCVLDVDRRELFRASREVPVAPQVFDLLVHLARHRDRVVDRDELIREIWTGRIVSESTLASHINAARKAVGDDGRRQHIIRTIARKGFRFIADTAEDEAPAPARAAAHGAQGGPSTQGAASGPQSTSSDMRGPAFGMRSAVPAGPSGGPPRPEAAEVAAAPALPTKPSIAVLPFVNLGTDPEQDYLADGVVEDIIAALSQYRWLFVVARNSSFAYKAHVVDVKQVGRELGVRYVLEGSWRRAGNRVRITGQLVDAGTGAHHWAGRYEGILGDIFELQDRLTESVVGAIAPQLERAEIERARRKPTESLGAYDYYLRGMARVHHGSADTIDQALPLFHAAIAADPEFASAYAMAAWCHCWRKVNGWMRDPEREAAEGARLARCAVDLGRGDAVALTRSGHALGHLAGDLQGGITLLDRALMLNQNLAAAWFLGAFLRLWHGETSAAIEHFTRAMRFSPLDPELYRMQAGMATAHLFEGRFDDAASWAGKASRVLPSFLLAAAILAASHALAGRPAEARRALDHVRALDPALRLSGLTGWLPIHRPGDLATLAEGLRKAGLPEA